MYAATYQALFVVWHVSLLIFMTFMHYFEVPAATEWNPFDQNTPRWQSPRIGYQLVLGDSNFGTGFSLWHIMMPLRGSETFSEVERAQFDHLQEQPAFFIDYNPHR